MPNNDLTSAREILSGRLCSKHNSYDPACHLCFIRANVLYEIDRANLDRLTPHNLVQLSKMIEAEMNRRKCINCGEHIDMRREHFNDQQAEFCSHECFLEWAEGHR